MLLLYVMKYFTTPVPDTHTHTHKKKKDVETKHDKINIKQFANDAEFPYLSIKPQVVPCKSAKGKGSKHNQGQIQERTLTTSIIQGVAMVSLTGTKFNRMIWILFL